MSSAIVSRAGATGQRGFAGATCGGVQRGFRAEVIRCEAASQRGFPPDLQYAAAFAQRQPLQPQRDAASRRKVVVQMVNTRHYLKSRSIFLDAERAVEVFLRIAGVHPARHHHVGRNHERRPGVQLAQLGDGRRRRFRLLAAAPFPEPGVVTSGQQQKGA